MSKFIYFEGYEAWLGLYKKEIQYKIQQIWYFAMNFQNIYFSPAY